MLHLVFLLNCWVCSLKKLLNLCNLKFKKLLERVLCSARRKKFFKSKNPIIYPPTQPKIFSPKYYPRIKTGTLCSCGVFARLANTPQAPHFPNKHSFEIFRFNFIKSFAFVVSRNRTFDRTKQC